MAGEAIQMARSLISERWNDTARRRFDENYLEPMDPKLVRALHAIKRLQEVLAEAERSCGPM
jgi:hypothetical protein